MVFTDELTHAAVVRFADDENRFNQVSLNRSYSGSRVLWSESMVDDKKDEPQKDESRKDVARKKFEDGIEELSQLPAEDRLDIYEGLFSEGGEDSPSVRLFNRQDILLNRAVFLPFRREEAEISKDGFVVRRKPRVFLSHSHEDKKLARRIYKYLQAGGIRVWFDEAELRFGDSLIAKLRGAIDTVDILLAMLSHNSIESEWVKKEIEIAMNQEIYDRRVKVIPLLCDPVELPGFLVGKFYADLQSNASRKRNLPKLVSDIKAHLEDTEG